MSAGKYEEYACAVERVGLDLILRKHGRTV